MNFFAFVACLAFPLEHCKIFAAPIAGLSCRSGRGRHVPPGNTAQPKNASHITLPEQLRQRVDFSLIWLKSPSVLSNILSYQPSQKGQL